MKLVRHPLKAVQPDRRPAVTVADISDPASVRDGMEVLEQDVVHLEKMPFRARRVMVRLPGSIAFRWKFLANPDLPQRFRLGADLNADDATTYYGGGTKGYTDYPSLDQERGEVARPCVDERWR